LKKPIKKRAGGLAQGIGPKFKLQHCKMKKKGREGRKEGREGGREGGRARGKGARRERERISSLFFGRVYIGLVLFLH
jgi:hypothetical protein